MYWWWSNLDRNVYVFLWNNNKYIIFVSTSVVVALCSLLFIFVLLNHLQTFKFYNFFFLNKVYFFLIFREKCKCGSILFLFFVVGRLSINWLSLNDRLHNSSRSYFILSRLHTLPEIIERAFPQHVTKDDVLPT